jgi:tight adherence protein B
VSTAHHASFWAGTPALVLVVLAGSVLLTLAVLALIVPRARRHDVRGRVEEFTPPAADDLQALAQPAATAPKPEWGERLFGGRAWWGELSERLEIARIERSASNVLGLTALATLTVAAVLSLLGRTPALAIPVLAAGPAAMLAIVNSHLARQRNLFGEQLPSHLEELASAMRAGHSLVGGMRTIAASAVEPIRTELERVLADEQLGVALHEALLPMRRRMACDDVQQIALVAALHERTGGNMAAVLDHVAEGVRERLDLRRELRSLTAQARLSRWVITALPVALVLFMAVANPGYLSPLVHTTAGVILLALATCLVIAGSLAMKMLVDVEG